MYKFKPCPFCGSLNLNAGDHFVTCFTCHTAGPFANSKEKAVLLWNHTPRKEDAEIEQNCESCKYNLNGYCGAVPPYKSFKVDDHLCCTDWEVKESKSTPLNTSNSRGLDAIGEIARKTGMEDNVRQLLENGG